MARAPAAVRLAPQSTYIRRPPYWDTEGVGALAAHPRTAEGHAPAGHPADNITTDHLSPSNAILPAARRANTWRAWACRRRLQLYATHRGDHLTAMRATFANPQLVNEMAVVDGNGVQRLAGARGPRPGDAHVEAIETYPPPPAAHHHCGADYAGVEPRLGRQGRAAGRGPRWWWPRGFERIHRTNLRAWGVLPLEFARQPPRWGWTAPGV